MNKERLTKIMDLLSETNLLISEMAVELTEQPFDLTDQLTWDLPDQMKYLTNLAESGVIICGELEKFTKLFINEIPTKSN